MGYIVSSEGVKASKEKIRVIIDWPQPTSVRDIRSFLSLANYYRRFVKNFLKVARPLTDLTQDKVKFQWGQDQEAAFNQLKYSLATSPILKLPDYNLEFILTTDASSASVGAVIEQDQGRGLQPVAYDSHKLSDTKARYSAYKRELLGVVYAIGKWRHYVEGRHFTVRTNHSSFRHLPNQPSVNRRIWKWIAILQIYDCTITHIPGVHNPADALTRKAWLEDRVAAHHVQDKDEDLVEKLRVSNTATNEEIQIALDKVFQKSDQTTMQLPDRDSVEVDIDKFFPAIDLLERVPALYVTETQVELEQIFGKEMLAQLRTEEPYSEIINTLEDPDTPSTWVREEGIFKLQGNLLKIHRPHRDDEMDQELPY